MHTIFNSIITALLLAELNAWLPWLTKHFLQVAIRLLPAEKRERFSEEWDTLISETPGKLAAAIRALDLIRGAWQVRIREQQKPVSNKLARRFTLNRVEITNSTVYPPGTFMPLAADKIGQSITLADAREIARGITKRYRDDDYILSQAVIPNQNLHTGTLRLRVVEGFINEVFFEDENSKDGPRTPFYPHNEFIRSRKPVRMNDLKNYMQLVNSIPGVTARGIVRPSQGTFGAADFYIKMETQSSL